MRSYLRFTPSPSATAWAVTVAAVALTGATLVAGQASVEQTLEVLGSRFRQERSKAIATIESSSSLKADERIRAALFAELRAVQDERVVISARQARGLFVEADEGRAEYQIAVLRAVRSLRDPRAIPLLVEAAGTGGGVWRGLAEFGDLAVPAVLATWYGRTTRDRPTLQVLGLPFGLLHTLKAMVEGGRLSASSREAVLTVAHGAIEQPDDASVLEAAVDLALALQDPELVSQVEAIAQDLGEVYRRGVQDPERAERIQRLAVEALGKAR